MQQDTKTSYNKDYYQRNRELLLQKQKVRQAKRAAADPEAMRRYRKDYYEANKERLLAQQRERGRKNYAAKPDGYRARAKTFRLKQYGLTTRQFEEMLKAQNGMCLICVVKMDPPAVDHCHATGKVRGLLCRGCNSALGLFRESAEMLDAAAQYLRKASSGAT